MGLPFDSAQGPPEKLNHKFYFLLNEGSGCYKEDRKNQNVYIEKSGMHCGCGGCAFSDFICAVNYLEYEADWTVFLMADFFVSCVKSFKGDGCKK